VGGVGGLIATDANFRCNRCATEKPNDFNTTIVELLARVVPNRS
jgi:hypothetical protein